MPSSRSELATRPTLDMDAITSVAVALFTELGYEKTSMDRIAQELKVTKAALYYHAANGKKEILSIALHQALDPMMSSLQKIVASDSLPVEKLRQAIALHVKHAVERGSAVAYFLRSDHHPLGDQAKEIRRAYDQSIADVYLEAYREGSVRADLDPRVGARLVLGLSYSITEWVKPSGRISVEEIAAQVISVAFEGIGQHPSANST
ncbi:MAG: TetR/AcrR family transcriptional regulator [Antricoccus sp.]